MLQHYAYTHPTSGRLYRVTEDSEHVSKQGRITVYDSTGSHVVKSCNLATINNQNVLRLLPYGHNVHFNVTGFNLAEITPDAYPELFL